MATEEEKRLHRCCFTGHRPEKLNASEEEVKTWLEAQIDQTERNSLSWKQSDFRFENSFRQILN